METSLNLINRSPSLTDTFSMVNYENPESTTQARTRLVVLFGGQSAEHDVSRVTAAHVLRALDTTRYDVVPVGISRSGQWVFAEQAAKALEAGPLAVPAELEVDGPDLDPMSTIVAHDPEPLVVLPLLHGPMGEDGTVQGLLEMAGVPYVGAGVLGSALSMDKAKAKEVIAHAGIPQALHLSFRDDEVDHTLADQVDTALGWPVFVKPANLGSSVGVSKAADANELTAAVELALSYDRWVVIEEAIDGREIEIGVLGNADPKVSVPGEIVPGAEFYDYDDKYHGSAAELIIPAKLPADVAADLDRLAVASYRALRVEGMARVDFFLEPRRGLLLNEINTIPGFTPISMFPKLWAQSGVPYPDLIEELIALALERHAHRKARTTRP